MASRFQPSDFQHNLRVAAALVPSLAVLAGFGGQIPAAVLLVRATRTKWHRQTVTAWTSLSTL